MYFKGVLFSDQIYAFRDLSRYYYPLRWFVVEQMRSGVFPLWNPFVASGHPIYASLQSVVLYPLSFIYYIGDFSYSFNVFIVAHIFLGGLFFYFMMRGMGFPWSSGIISGIVFMFSGYLISVINLTTTLAAAIWFPLVFLFFHKAVTGRSFFSLVLTSVFMCIMFLGGEPTPLYSTVFILGVYTAWQMISEKELRLRSPFFLLLGIVMFLLLSSFQILPFLEHLGQSVRGQTGAVYENVTKWSFHPSNIMNFIMPFFFGPLDVAPEDPLRQDWMLLSYLGIIPLLLFAVSLIFDRSRIANVFKVIFITGLFLAFGRFSFVYDIFYRIMPGLGYIRYPVKFFFMSAVGFAFLAGSGWALYLERARAREAGFVKFIKILFAASFAAALVFFMLYIFKEQVYALGKMFLEPRDQQSGSLELWSTFMVNLFNFKRLLVFFIVGVFLMFIGARKKVPSVIISSAMVLLVLTDLYGMKNLDVNPTISREGFLSETPTIRFIQEDDGLFRVYTSSRLARINEYLKGKDHEEAFAASKNRWCPNRLMPHRIYDARGYLSVHNANYSKVFNLIDTAPSPDINNILSMLNVKYIMTPQELKAEGYELAEKGEDHFIYRNLGYLPRAYLVPDHVVLTAENEIAAKLKTREFDPSRTVILEEEIVAPERKGEVPPAENDTEEVMIKSYSANEVLIEASVVDKPKFLVLADTYYPGWKVFVNGVEEHLYKANFTLRGVYLPPGENLVRFVYDPVSFKLGIAISCLTVILLAITAVLVRAYKNNP